MNILIMKCHTQNRGDEAANIALINQINHTFPNSEITLAILGLPYPDLPSNVKVIAQYAL